MGPGRQGLLEPVIERLRTQTRQGETTPIVSIMGLVVAPGDYPWEENMKVVDLIRAAGQLTEAAYTISAEISRQEVVDGQYREVSHYTITKTDIHDGYAATEFTLQPYDSLHIKRIPQWSDVQTIELIGEFQFPGVYPFRRGETLRQVIARAGGVTDAAFPDGAIFTREDLREKEQEQIDNMALRLEADLAAMQLERQQQDNAKQAMDMQAVGMANSLLRQLRETRAVGRLVIDLPKILREPVVDEEFPAPRGTPIILKNGDKLYVPSQTQEVTIIGEVQQSTSHLYSNSLDRDDYINMSGGMTYKADDDRIYIVRANGAVVTDNNTGWFGSSSKVYPGDTIVVPLDADRMRPLTFWTNITQIVYQLGVAAAAWNSIGVF
jgi:protein involved in polysaccharide export with SLBB domain